MFEIKEGAIFIGDVHYAPYRSDSIQFFEYLIENPPTQLFLLGDIFDLLTPSKYQIDQNRNLIKLIEELSRRCEILFFEGNHDIGMRDIFKHMVIFSRKQQPALFIFNQQHIYVSHGDKFGNFTHELYMRIISNPILLTTLNKLDDFLDGAISKKITESIKNKKLCREMNNFNHLINSRIQKMKLIPNAILIEGHFHQDKFFPKIYDDIDYYNISSFACNKSFFVVKSLDSQFSLKNRSIKEFLCP